MIADFRARLPVIANHGSGAMVANDGPGAMVANFNRGLRGGSNIDESNRRKSGNDEIAHDLKSPCVGGSP